MSVYTLHITKSCNLNCDYCYEKDKTSQYPFEEIKKNIDEIFLNINEKVTIEFIGGETLLRFDLVEKAFYYMEKNYKHSIFNYIITTNGTILNDKILNFLTVNMSRIAFSVSIDGDEESNKRRFYKNGRSSYNDTINTLKKLINLKPIVHIVTNKINVNKTYDNIIMFYEMGITKISIGFIQSTEFLTENEFDMLKIQLMKIIDYRNDNDINLYIDVVDTKPSDYSTKIYVRDLLNDKIIFESSGSISSGFMENINKKFSNKERYQLSITLDKDIYGKNIFNLKNILYTYNEEKNGNTKL